MEDVVSIHGFQKKVASRTRTTDQKIDVDLGSVRLCRGEINCTSVGLNDLPTDRQSQTRAVLLGGLEQAEHVERFVDSLLG